MASVGEYPDPFRAARLEAGPAVQDLGSETHWEARELRSRLPFAQGPSSRPYLSLTGPFAPGPAPSDPSLLWVSSLGCGGEGEDCRAMRLRAWECAASGLPPPC